MRNDGPKYEVTADELIKLLDAGDLTELAIRVNRALLAKHYPQLRYAVLVGGFPNGVAPDLCLPIIPLSPTEPASGFVSSGR
ncbi:unnamed protein product [Gemmata massiliana]|uniref:Uncharacterized protein n=1 Tax=Gemmata massiliana TaxID=1210884 RepID=A0A6P2DEN6_9BACT|nr:unnamed protein product [Gemmata massiliana]